LKASDLYKIVDSDFIKPGIIDAWARYMEEISDFLTDSFKTCSMGLMCDNTTKINKVYTAVFPSKKIMEHIAAKNETDILLLLHHAKIWDINAPDAWVQMERTWLDTFKAQRIAIYLLHHPLDNYGEYSTSGTLAKTLNIQPQEPFADMFGIQAGVFGKTECSTIHELKAKFDTAVNHETRLYQYGDKYISNQTIGVVAGGGFAIDILNDVKNKKVNTFITGVTCLNDYNQEAHEYANEHHINILGGTHYSTEKFACSAMCKYFEKHGLPTEFIEEEPLLADM
jgi:putative NIF3 family GTP cyclohydrolase 1 type 2